MIEFTRKGTDKDAQYFEGRKITRKNSIGEEYTYYVVDKVYIMDKYREGT